MEKTRTCDAPICAPEMEIYHPVVDNDKFMPDDNGTYSRNCLHNHYNCGCKEMDGKEFNTFCENVTNLEDLKKFIYSHQIIFRYDLDGGLDYLMYTGKIDLIKWVLEEFFPRQDYFYSENYSDPDSVIYYRIEGIIREGYPSLLAWMMEFYNLSAEDLTENIGYNVLFYSVCKSGNMDFISSIIELCEIPDDEIESSIKTIGTCGFGCMDMASANFEDNVEIIIWLSSKFKSTKKVIQKNVNRFIYSAMDHNNFNIAEWYMNTYNVPLIDALKEEYYEYSHETCILDLIERNNEKTAVWAARMLNIPDEILIKFPEIYEACKENESLVKFAGKLT